jgi:hypothetical protein
VTQTLLCNRCFCELELPKVTTLGSPTLACERCGYYPGILYMVHGDHRNRTPDVNRPYKSEEDTTMRPVPTVFTDGSQVRKLVDYSNAGVRYMWLDPHGEWKGPTECTTESWDAWVTTARSASRAEENEMQYCIVCGVMYYVPNPGNCRTKGCDQRLLRTVGG